ncbi:MAG: MFS transporter [Gemmataceae bacterium]|nr:MFS transporter [Gemmataceae bacterium]
MTSPTSPAVTAEPGSRPTLVRYGVLAALCLAATIAYVQRNSIGVAERTMRFELGLTRAEMGHVMSAFLLTYAIFQLPSGWLAHVWGSRRALTIFVLLFSATTGLMGLAASFLALVLARLGMGAAQAGIFPCSTSSIAKWFPPTRRAFASGALGSFMSVGGAVGAILTGALLEEGIPWQWLFVLYALPGVLWGIWFYFWFRDTPAEHRGVNPQELALIEGPRPRAEAESASTAIQAGPPPAAVEPATHAPEPTPWGAILTSSAMWWICGQQFFRAAAYMFFATWFPTYLQEHRGLTRAQAAWLTSLPFWGVVVGGFVGGAVSDWILVRTGSRRLSRQGVAVVSMAAASLTTGLTFAAESIALVAVLFTASAFFAALAGPCGYTITIDMGGRHVTTVFSMMNMAGNVGAMIFPAVVPYLVMERPDWVTPASSAGAVGQLATPGSGGLGAMPGLLASRLASWDLAIIVLAGTYLAAALCWALLNPNGNICDRREPAAS